jgi:hypothetical protein
MSLFPLVAVAIVIVVAIALVVTDWPVATAPGLGLDGFILHG